MISATHQTVSPPVSPARTAQPVPENDKANDRDTTGDNAEDIRTANLDKAEAQQLRELKARDREVRAHEQAHLSAAGGHARSGASYTYERGPDQRMYAVGGEVQVDTSAVPNDPVATLRKAQIIRQAALAPVNPSSQDRQVAAQATQMENEARAEIAAQNEESVTTPAGANESGSPQASPGAGTSADKNLETSATCPACGGAHSSGAHDGLTAYAAVKNAQVGDTNTQH